MSDHDAFDNALIDDAFAGFTAAAAATVRRVDTAAVYTTVARRRRLQVMAYSVLALLAIAVPVTAYAVTTNRGQGPPPPGPAASSEPEPEGTPTTSPSPAPSRSLPPVNPDPRGRLTLGQLKTGNHRVPSWAPHGSACPTGSVSLDNYVQPNLRIDTIVHANLDADDLFETAVELSCGDFAHGNGADATQILAFDRDGSGSVITLGTVALFGPDINVVEMVRRPRGGVTLKLSSIVLSGTPHEMEVREYAWNGAKIALVPLAELTKNAYAFKDFNILMVPVPAPDDSISHCGLPGAEGFKMVDVNDDGDFELAVLIRCRQGSTQVVVYDHDDRGNMVLMGQVISSVTAAVVIRDFGATPRGDAVAVTVAPAGSDLSVPGQERFFDWNGTGFDETQSPK